MITILRPGNKCDLSDECIYGWLILFIFMHNAVKSHLTLVILTDYLVVEGA